ncbi:MAG: acyl-homoserine-lactone synthase [Pseudomonadota bacterium]
MIRFCYATDLDTHPHLRDAMLRDRAVQFQDRLGWDVAVDRQGRERDEYDDINPLYVIATDSTQSQHLGSMRLLPTTGQTMVNDHFTNLMGGGTIQSPLIWESTRFCLAPKAPRSVAAHLMLAGGKILNAFELESFVGVFDLTMLRVYRALGASPDVLGRSNEIGVGLWTFTPGAQARLARRANIDPAAVDASFSQDL